MPRRNATRFTLLGLALGAALLLGLAMGRRSAEPGPATAPAAVPDERESGLLIQDPKPSLFYIPLGSATVTEAGVEAGRHILDYLDLGDPASLRAAVAIYDRVIPLENFGGEYTSLRWLCKHALATPEEKQRMASDADGARLLRFLFDEDPSRFRAYLLDKYKLYKGTDQDAARFVDEIVRFNGPGRNEWEKSDQILEVFGPARGDVVADVGAGAGYFSFRLATLVGPQGRVHALEINPRHVRYMKQVVRQEGIANLEPRISVPTDLGLEEDSLDYAFMCSTYQVIYASLREDERERFLASLKLALKPGARLVISDNDPLVRDAVPYRGISIARSLVIAQLQAHGFRLQGQRNFIPQRYLLEFVAD